MTIAELDRFFTSQMRVKEREERKRASFDYVLADLIGRSIARVDNSANKMPTISEAYPDLFSSEEVAEKAQEKRNELSILRFKQFSQIHNNKFNSEVKAEE